MLRHGAGLFAVGVLLAACAGDQPEATPSEMTAPVFAVGGNKHMNLGTHLRGDEEVLAVPAGAPHPSGSPAQGQATFRVNEDGTVDFRLIASNIDNVIMAHIHCGRPGQNGPVRMWLSPVVGPTGGPLPPGGGPQDGVLASGTFNPTGVVCPASSVGANMPLLAAMRAGLTYVNVHTNDGIAPINTGPGDFPGGEVRGQIDHPKGR